MRIASEREWVRGLTRAGYGLLAAVCLSSGALAQQISYCFTADGSQVVPPTNSGATAQGMVTLDLGTRTLYWNITHSGLTGMLQASHFHGPAAVGKNANIQISLGTANPLVGSATLNAGQVADILAGLWYVNLHTATFGSGEIRGQVVGICAQTHCTSLSNSFDGSGARLLTTGDFVAVDNALIFNATGVPPNQFGYLLIGQSTNTVVPPSSSGLLCLAGGPIGRLNKQVLQATAGGQLGPFTPDILNLPNAMGSVMAGETWCLQAWFRDGPTNNFTDAVSIVFQ